MMSHYLRRAVNWLPLFSLVGACALYGWLAGSFSDRVNVEETEGVPTTWVSEDEESFATLDELLERIGPNREKEHERDDVAANEPFDVLAIWATEPADVPSVSLPGFLGEQSFHSPEIRNQRLSELATLLDGCPNQISMVENLGLKEAIPHVDMHALSAKQKVYVLEALDRQAGGDRLERLSRSLALQYDGAPLKTRFWETALKPHIQTTTNVPLGSANSEQLSRFLDYYSGTRNGSPISQYCEWFNCSPEVASEALIQAGSFEGAVHQRFAAMNNLGQQDLLKTLYEGVSARYESVRYDPRFESLRSTLENPSSMEVMFPAAHSKTLVNRLTHGER